MADVLDKIGRLLSVGQLPEGVDAALPRGRVLQLFLSEIPSLVVAHLGSETEQQHERTTVV